MRILHVVPTYLPAVRYGGPIWAVHGLAKALVRHGHEVEIFTTNVDGHLESPVPVGEPVVKDGVVVWYFRSPLFRRMYWAPKMAGHLAHAIRNFDIVHLHSVFLWPTYQAAKLARNVGVPYVLSPRGMLEKNLFRMRGWWRKQLWWYAVGRRHVRHAAALHATSQREASELLKFGVDPARLWIVPNGIELEKPDSCYSISDELARLITDPYVLYLGRINWKKGLDRLVHALGYIPQVRLIIAGNDDEGYLSRVRQLSAATGAVSQIHYIGPVYGEEKRLLFQHAVALVLPSYSENFGNVVLEAMASGCPVIVTKEVGLAEAVQISNAGIVVPGEPRAIANAIARLSQDSGLRKRCGAAGRDLVVKEYTWDAVARRMQEHYAELVSGNE